MVPDDGPDVDAAIGVEPVNTYVINAPVINAPNVPVNVPIGFPIIEMPCVKARRSIENDAFRMIESFSYQVACKLFAFYIIIQKILIS